MRRCVKNRFPKGLQKFSFVRMISVVGIVEFVVVSQIMLPLIKHEIKKMRGKERQVRSLKHDLASWSKHQSACHLIVLKPFPVSSFRLASSYKYTLSTYRNIQITRWGSSSHIFIFVSDHCVLHKTSSEAEVNYATFFYRAIWTWSVTSCRSQVTGGRFGLFDHDSINRWLYWFHTAWDFLKFWREEILAFVRSNV